MNLTKLLVVLLVAGIVVAIMSARTTVNSPSSQLSAPKTLEGDTAKSFNPEAEPPGN